MKMSFQKISNIRISKNGDATNIFGSNNAGKDVQGTYMNALVAYVP